MNKENIALCYPGFTTKALTFSMDDGRVDQDGELLEILRPVGIKGTFNLPSADRIAPEEYRRLYDGYEIANHCKYHPYVFDDDVKYVLSEDPFDPEAADPDYIYRHPERESFYYFKRSIGWRIITDPDTYVRCVAACHAELESVFGEGSVNSYVWPFYEQNSRAVKEYLKTLGYYAVRQSGLVLDSTGFDMPERGFGWKCNANHTNILTLMKTYEEYPDDGRLKMFAFGVHASDFAKHDCWESVRELAIRYGNRPEDFWYATVKEIFDYKAASERLIVRDGSISNAAFRPLYIRIGSEKVALNPGEKLDL